MACAFSGALTQLPMSACSSTTLSAGCAGHMDRRLLRSSCRQLPPPQPNSPFLRDGQFLGRGASKSVTARKRNGILVAVMTSLKGDLMQEAKLMMKLSQQPHQHLLQLIAIEYDASSKASMVAPIARFGSMYDLADHLEFEGMYLSTHHVVVVVLQVLSALLHLNSLQINHGDVCGRNVLVFEFDVSDPRATHVRLGDYGEARQGQCDLHSVIRLAAELHVLVPR